jgi:hypothetical protein
MVAIVADNGLGLFNTSLNTVGAAGAVGQSAVGQGSHRAIVNVVNGNLVLQSQDGQLAGRGTDLFALRTYNSLGVPTDLDGDGWRWNYEQTVRFPGTPAHPAPGATVVRTDGDGHETTHTWDAARAAYVATEGSGAHDELRYDSAAAEWVWTDGTTRVTELCRALPEARLCGHSKNCGFTSPSDCAGSPLLPSCMKETPSIQIQDTFKITQLLTPRLATHYGPCLWPQGPQCLGREARA